MADDRLDYLNITDEVKAALEDLRPVIALESTILAHGLPYPENIELARELEQMAREYGVIPATIAVVQGKVQVGLSESQLEEVAHGKGFHKLSRRDLAWALSTRQNGATTVATTMMCAHMAGIDWFATGGIGGVHRGVEESWDVSADLTELSQTPVAVITAGAKAILDIPKTLEVLETYGVPVIGYQTGQFPAFYSRTSGCPTAHRMDSVEEIAQLFRYQRMLGHPQGLVVANPIPTEHALDVHVVESHIDEALEMARDQHVSGKALTPFLLARLAELTKGRSVEANKALVRNNVMLACQCATAASALALQKPAFS
ncbi:MAG: pseudouridine-5'-phosphate glycosidase [Flavobacteriales bacterium]|nr:pseudouridine-5'-phosphate glycosidase [Flavobacteriales bacterium]